MMTNVARTSVILAGMHSVAEKWLYTCSMIRYLHCSQICYQQMLSRATVLGRACQVRVRVVKTLIFWCKGLMTVNRGQNGVRYGEVYSLSTLGTESESDIFCCICKDHKTSDEQWGYVRPHWRWTLHNQSLLSKLNHPHFDLQSKSWVLQYKCTVQMLQSIKTRAAELMC